jgi:NADPH2:quinone reductase
MRAVQVTSPDGPGALEIRDVPEPTADGPFGPQLLVDVHAVGISFPDLLLSKGEYQLKPEPPFTLGVDFAGVVRSAPDGSGFAPGDRVAACLSHGGAAETVGLGPDSVFPLPDSLSFAQGAAIPMNYLTAQFALKERGQVRAGETVLVHGAAGGVGTACLQVAKGLGARTIAVVSSDAKEAVAREAGADEVLRSDGPWREQATELTGGGVEMVIDPVGGDRFLDSLRALATGGRLVVVGFAGGPIPELKVNRLLLNNVEVIGAAWGPYTRAVNGAAAEIGAGVDALIESGFVRPLIGARFPLDRAADALVEIDHRRAIGKVILDVT